MLQNPTVPAERYDRAAAGAEAGRFFEGLWREGDPWALETSPLDQDRYGRQISLLADRRYGRALEIGCAAGVFTERLVDLADVVVGIDIAAAAVDSARRRLGDRADLRAINVMDLEPHEDGPWDLVVIAETIYYLGWLYPLFDVAWLLHALHDATSPAGRLLLVDSISSEHGIMSHWLIRTYRDLASNVGYSPHRSEILEGTKEGVRFDVHLDLFVKGEP